MTQIITPLTLYTCIFEVNEYNWWNDSDGEGDSWIGQAYQWEIKFICLPQNTGDYNSSFVYNELNVIQGDWIVMSAGTVALSVQIVSNPVSVNGVMTAIVEDVDRYNLHLTSVYGINAASNYGSFDSLIFRLSSDGLPQFVSLTSNDLAATVYQETLSRFEFRNYLQNNYRVYQDGNTFSIGDEISLNSDGNYVLASAIGTAAYRAVGRIRDINIPGVGWFTFEPKGKLCRYLTPGLPGNPGDIIYLDPQNPGKLTDTKPTIGIAVPIFIKIDSSTGIKLDEVLPGGLDNFSATVPPTVNDDSGDGYSYGSLWVDIVNKKSYINVDPTVGASIWQEIGAGSGAGSTGYTGSKGDQGDPGGYTGSRGFIGYTGSAAIANASTQTFTGTGIRTIFTLNSIMVNQNNAIVTINGLVQYPTLHYTISGNTLSFTFAPYLNSIIEVRNIENGTGSKGYTGSSGYVGSAATVSIASKDQLGVVQIGENINVTNEGLISITKGAGINKVVDIPDVISENLIEGSYLSYRQDLARWEASTIGAIDLDGGYY
jgi:hypothetical protein